MLSPLDSLSAILSDTLLWVLGLLKLLSAVLPWQIPAWVATPLLVLALLALTFALGSVAQSQLGNWMGRLIQQGLNAIPLLPQLYGSIRQLTLTLLPATLDSDKAFRGTILTPLALGHTIALTQSSPAQFQGILPAGYSPAFIPSAPNVAQGILCFCPPTLALPLSTDSALNTVLPTGFFLSKTPFLLTEGLSNLLRERRASLRGTHFLAYLLDISQSLRSVRLALRPLATVL